MDNGINPNHNPNLNLNPHYWMSTFLGIINPNVYLVGPHHTFEDFRKYSFSLSSPWFFFVGVCNKAVPDWENSEREKRHRGRAHKGVNYNIEAGLKFFPHIFCSPWGVACSSSFLCFGFRSAKNTAQSQSWERLMPFTRGVWMRREWRTTWGLLCRAPTAN